MLHDKATTSQPLGRCFDSRGAGGPAEGAERSAPGFGSRAHPGARRPPAGDRPPAPPSPWPGLSAGGRAGRQRFSATPSHVAPRERERSRSRSRVGAGSRPVGAGSERGLARCFAGGASRCAFFIPPQRFKERARNLTGGRTCRVLRRTSARLLRSPYFPERGRCELPWDLNHHQALQFLI